MSAPQRILILRHGYYPQDPRVRREAEALVAAGHTVQIICLRDRGEVAHEVVAGVAVTRLPLGHRRASMGRYVGEYGAFFVAAASLAGWRHLRRRFDVVQVNTMPDALVFAALIPKMTGARIVLDLHELMPELACSKFGVGPAHPLPRFLAAVEQGAVRFADRCLAVSGPCLDRYVARGAARCKFTVVMNSPDPTLFAPPKGPIVVPAGGAPCLISHGTLVERHGFDLLLHALAELPGVQLAILGDGESRPRLQALAVQLGVAERVTFAGVVPLSQVPARIAGATLGVIANRSDPFMDLVLPTKLLEYVAMGVPAVVARTPAVAAHFGADEVGYFAAGDAADLARTVRALLADPHRRSAMAAKAKAALDRHWAWPIMAERYVRVVTGGA